MILLAEFLRGNRPGSSGSALRWRVANHEFCPTPVEFPPKAAILEGDCNRRTAQRSCQLLGTT